MKTYLQARDEMYGDVRGAWIAGITLLVNPPSTPVILYPGDATPSPDSGLTYAKPSFVVVSRPQKTLRRTLAGLSLFESTCIYTLQIFAPESQADGLDNATVLGETVRARISKASSSGDLWYRGAKATPVPGPVGLSQVNVTSTVVFQSEE